MAKEIIDLAIDEDDDKLPKKGTTKTNPISVENYKPIKNPKRVINSSQKSFLFDNKTSKVNPISVDDYKPIRNPKRAINSTQKPFFFDEDEVQILPSIPKTAPKTKLYKGESSNSKPDRIPSNCICEICADEKPRSSMFRIQGCTHYYCSDCMSKYIASKLQDNISVITCPVSNCPGFLEPYHCHSILPKQVFDRWGDALCEAVILGSEKFYCPFKDCSALLIVDSDNKTVVESECPNCNRLFCVQCKVAWHNGFKCDEFQNLKKDERSNEDIMLMNLAKDKNWQRCLKCGFYVEKKDGCLFMKCRCGNGFCYLCGAEMPVHLHYCTKCKR